MLLFVCSSIVCEWRNFWKTLVIKNDNSFFTRMTMYSLGRGKTDKNKKALYLNTTNIYIFSMSMTYTRFLNVFVK